MGRFVVTNEDELASVVNSVISYSDNLTYAIEAFKEIMLLLQNNGVEDKLISDELNNLSAEIQESLPGISSATEGLARDIKAFMEEIKNADSFDFPEIIVSRIESIFNSFI